jgi:acetyl esterase/lipase
MNSIISIAWLVVSLNMLNAQVPRDTSYTLYSAFQKIKKNYPEVRLPIYSSDERIRIERDVVYSQLDNRQLHADVYFMPNDIIVPGVVLVHGGGWSSGDKSMHMNVASELAADGFVVLVPEYRLSPEATFPAAVTDIRTAISWMRAHADEYSIDDQKIALIGFSAGGQLAALVGTTAHIDNFQDDGAPAPGAVQAIIDIDGVLKFRHPVSEEGTMAARWLGSTYEQRPNSWEVASPLNHVSERTPPTLFIASSYPRFLAGHEEFMTALGRFGIRTEKRQMNNAPHSFWLVEPWYSQTRFHITSFLTEIFKLTR